MHTSATVTIGKGQIPNLDPNLPLINSSLVHILPIPRISDVNPPTTFFETYLDKNEPTEGPKPTLASSALLPQQTRLDLVPAVV